MRGVINTNRWLPLTLVVLLAGCQANSVKQQPLTLAPLSPDPSSSPELLADAPELTAVYLFVPELRFDNAMNNTMSDQPSQLEIKQNNRTIALIPPLGMLKLELLPNQRYQLNISETGNPYWVKQVIFDTPPAGQLVAYDAYTTLFNLSDYPVFKNLDLVTTQERINHFKSVPPKVPGKKIALGAVSLGNYFDSCLDPSQQTLCQQQINALPAGYIPDSIATAMTETQAAEQQKQAEQQQKQDLINLEASLPASVRRDKYMVQLSQDLKAQDYTAALKMFPKLEALPVATDPSLKFFYGEALLKTGQPAKALQKLYEYINDQGNRATHYARALELINQAENSL